MRIHRMEAGRIAVIGDVHLAHAGAPLGFAGDGGTLYRLLTHLRDTHDFVVINGDLYDLDRGAWPWSFREEREASDAAYPEIAALLGSDAFVTTAGNHDAQLDWLDAVEVSGPAGRVWLEHGHRFDAPIKRWRAFTRWVTWTSGQVASFPRVLSPMRARESVLTRGPSDGPQGCPIETRAERFMKHRPDVSVMVIGHTHIETIRAVGGAWLVNPGESMQPPYTWTSIDLDAGLVCNFRGDSDQSIEVRRAVLASRTSDCQV